VTAPARIRWTSIGSVDWIAVPNRQTLPALRRPARGNCKAGRVLFWVDAQLPPSLAPWLTKHFGVQAQSTRFLGLQAAEDADILERARAAVDIFIKDDTRTAATASCLIKS